MNKKRFLVEFDDSSKTYKSLDIPVPNVRVEFEEEENNDWYCDDCEGTFQDGESCNC